jgi:hypothetical protein
LAPNFEDLFGRELCSLLVSLEAVSHGSSKEIAHLLTEKSATGKIKKVKEYLRRIKRRVRHKERACHCLMASHHLLGLLSSFIDVSSVSGCSMLGELICLARWLGCCLLWE